MDKASREPSRPRANYKRLMSAQTELVSPLLILLLRETYSAYNAENPLKKHHRGGQVTVLPLNPGPVHRRCTVVPLAVENALLGK